MTTPEVSVHISSIEFTANELRGFLDRVAAVDELPANALIEVSHTETETDTGSYPVYTLKASTEFRRPQ